METIEQEEHASMFESCLANGFTTCGWGLPTNALRILQTTFVHACVFICVIKRVGKMRWNKTRNPLSTPSNSPTWIKVHEPSKPKNKNGLLSCCYCMLIKMYRILRNYTVSTLYTRSDKHLLSIIVPVCDLGPVIETLLLDKESWATSEAIHTHLALCQTPFLQRTKITETTHVFSCCQCASMHVC